jgi:hypothetical protein
MLFIARNASSLKWSSSSEGQEHPVFVSAMDDWIPSANSCPGWSDLHDLSLSTKLQSTVGNSGYVMGFPVILVDENGKHIPGEASFRDITAHLDRHSKAVMQDFYRRPEFCAARHKASLPNSLNGYKFIPAFDASDECQNSRISEQNPLTFYKADLTACQGCHMKRAPMPFRSRVRSMACSFRIVGRQAHRCALLL